MMQKQRDVSIIHQQHLAFPIYGSLPSKNPTLTVMGGLQIHGCGLSNLSDVKNQKNDGGTYNKCGKRQILKNLQRWIKRFFERWFS